MGNPVIVIPGYLGSKLAESVHRRLVWLDVNGLLSPEVTLEALRMDVGDPNRVVPVGILDEIAVLPPFWSPDVYKGLVAFLRNNLRLRVFEFFYDWRKPLAEAADLLNNQILRWTNETGASQVDIVAHSFGGVVARAYLTKHGAGHVDRLITVGTPHKGALQSLESMTTGRALFTFPPGKIRQVTRTFPSAYEVLPNDAADGMFRSGGQPANPMRATGWCQTDAMRQLAATARGQVDQLLPRSLPVSTWMVVGTRVPTLTSSNFDAGATRFTETEDGDGTVAEVSARGSGLTGAGLFRFSVPFGPHLALLGMEKVHQRIFTPILLRRPLAEVQLFAGFRNEPLFVPRSTNVFAASVFRLDGTPLLDAEVRLTISGTTVRDRVVPLSSRGDDYSLRIVMPGPGPGRRYTVTARVPGVGELTDQGLLLPTQS
ncbi:MAG TPA: hypothetical protein VIW92_13225 [Thermoanaerobaculia bacterium]